MFKDRLKELRQKTGISQYELAEKIFVSRSAVAKWENGLGMPSKESLELLCQFFNITKDELFKEEDPLIIIDNVQKKSNKIIKILIGILCFAVISYTALFIFVMIKERQDDLITPQHGMFYSEKYLEEFELNNLDMIPGEDYLLMGIEGSCFYSYIDSYEIFENYANYVYDKLQYSTSISYLSFSKELYDHFDPINSNTDFYLFPSNNLSDHIEETFDNGKVHVYSFYYVTKIDDRNAKEPINVNHIQLKFLMNNKYNETDRNWFQMVIENDDNNDIVPNIYLANDFFTIEEVRLSDQNIKDYIDVKVARDGLSINFNSKGSYLISPINTEPIPPFHLFLEVKIVLKEKETGNDVTYINKTVLAEEGTNVSVSSKDFNIESLLEFDVVFLYEVLEDSTFYKITEK